jgi:hypothetical protein
LHVVPSKRVMSKAADLQVGTPVAPFSSGWLMKANRIWIETVVLGAAIACACALLIATLAAVTAALTQSASAEVSQIAGQPVEPTQTAESDQSRTFEGMVTCSHCGAKHSAALGRNASDCARRCIHSGASFALIDGERIYILDGDLIAIKKVAGERARLVGALRGETIQVASIVAAN